MRFRAALLVGLFIATSGCRRSTEKAYAPEYARTAALPEDTRYSFGVPPVGTIRSLWERYSPLVIAINKSENSVRIKLESALTQEVYDAKVAGGRFDFAIIGSAKVLIAEQLGYRVIARTGRRDRIRGVIVVPADSTATRAIDLRGRTVAFSSRDDLAGAMLNQAELLDRGLDVRTGANVVYTRSAESSLLAAYLGRVDAAAVAEKEWLDYAAAHPEGAEELKVLCSTPALSGPAVMASRSVPKTDVVRLQRVLAQLKLSNAGLKALTRARVSGFDVAESASYDDVWEFLSFYKARFGRAPGLERSR